MAQASSRRCRTVAVAIGRRPHSMRRVACLGVGAERFSRRPPAAAPCVRRSGTQTQTAGGLSALRRLLRGAFPPEEATCCPVLPEGLLLRPLCCLSPRLLSRLSPVLLSPPGPVVLCSGTPHIPATLLGTGGGRRLTRRAYLSGDDRARCLAAAAANSEPLALLGADVRAGGALPHTDFLFGTAGEHGGRNFSDTEGAGKRKKKKARAGEGVT